MFAIDLKVAWRHLQRHAGVATLNVTGLAVGMTCCVFLLLYVYDELSYDRSYDEADRVFRVVTDVVGQDGTANRSAFSFSALGPAMVRHLPNVEATARVNVKASALIRVGGQHFQHDRLLVTDSSFFDLFSYHFLRGSPETALNRPYTVVLTRSTARRYFGDANPVGRTINLDNRDDLEVTAVIDDPPTNTHLRFDLLSTFATANALRPGRLDNQWRVLYAYTYVLLSDAAAAEAVEAELPALTGPHLRPLSEQWGNSFLFELQPLTRIHLHSHRDHEVEPGGHAAYIYLLAGAAALLLLIAGVNFVNLSTVQATSRAREVGVRKAAGASRDQLARQFLTESMLSATIAAAVATLLFATFLPAFNLLSGKAFSIVVLGTPVVAATFVAVTVLTGLAGGSYPARVLTGVGTARALRGEHLLGRSGTHVRRVLVVAAFISATVLTISAVVILQQLLFMRTAELGFDREHVVVIHNVFPSSMASQAQTIRDDLLQSSAVTSATLASEWPTRPAVGEIPLRVGRMPRGEALPAAWYQIDEHYLSLLDIDVVAGRGLAAHDSVAFVLNRTAVRRLGLSDETAVGQRILAPDEDETWGTVVGVVDDFHTRSLRDAVEPITFVHGWFRPRHLLVKIDGHDVSGALAHVEKTWTRHRPDDPIDYDFLDGQYDALYGAEVRLSRVVNVFAALAVLVASMGLLGIAAYSARQRTKEIGIRKALGATFGSIVLLLSRDVLRLVLLAVLIAAPIAYVGMHRWLGTFAYRTELSMWTFAAVGLAALGVAALPVGYQAVRAALADPVESLRYE